MRPYLRRPVLIFARLPVVTCTCQSRVGLCLIFFFLVNSSCCSLCSKYVINLCYANWVRV